MITLQVYGRKMTFSEEELTSIVEKHFSSEATQQAKTEEIAEKPTEGKWFKVNPLAIDQKLFENKRENSKQEGARKRILDAFEEMKKNPRYAKPFMTFIPEKTWERKTVNELQKLSCVLGDHNANWVEQALEWAQRIANGETWEEVCNKPDITNWYRLVVWKEEWLCKLVGGSRGDNSEYPATALQFGIYYGNMDVCHAVPLVVDYE